MTCAKTIFADEPVNRGRQAELDIAKAVITFLLAFIHCTIECTSEANLASGIPYFFDTVIGGPLAAPMLMFSMGVGMIYTRRNRAEDYIKRGLRLELGGLFLNISRFTIPYLIGYAVTADYDKYIDLILYRSFCNDIFQFAGLAMVLIGVFVYLKIPDIFMLTISIVMSICGMFFNGVDVGNPAANIFLGYLIGTEDAAGKVFSDFPLLNWFIVPVCGYIFGKYLIRMKDKAAFYRRVSPICIVVTVLYFACGIKYEKGMFGEGQNCYYHILTSDVLICITAAIGVLGVYFYLTKWIPERMMYWIKDISKNMTLIYCSHWVIVVVVTNLFIYILRGTQELSVPVTMLLSFVISVAAIIFSHCWSGRKRRKREE